MRQWQCRVCKYIHKGDEPPEVCPVCRASKEHFVEINREDDLSTAKGMSETNTDTKTSLILKHHVHPMTVHVPNGVIPISFLFLLTAIVLGFGDLSKPVFFNYIAVLAAMPVVIYSGIVEWKKRYKGILTAGIVVKLICATVVIFGLTWLVVWHVLNRDVVAEDSSSKWMYLGVSFIVLAATGIAGFIGGKLVFKD